MNAALLSLQPQDKARLYRVDGFSGNPLLVERLKEMGLHQGLSVQYLGRAPFSGPLLLRMGATVLALREEEAQCLLLKKS